MDRKDIINMTGEELRRVSVIKQAIDKQIIQRKGAEVIGISERQMRRLIKRVRQEGDKGIIHKSRGKPGNRKTDDKVKAEVIELYHKKYWDFGPTFASEKLEELDNITVNHETLRLWLIAGSKRNWQRKARPHRQWRQRKDCFGEMVQVDGSHHDWLEGRGPRLVFMGYVDDATSKAFGRFYDYEGTIPALDSLKRYIKKYGIPQSIYLDKHTTYKSPREPTIEEQLKNELPMTQFERAAKELGIIIIHANSAPAKGRVERGFGTHQDRLIKEMRLAGIKTKDGANEFLKTYLPKHNKRFSVPPAKKANGHRQAPGEKELKKTLCLKTKRGLRNDWVIRHNNKFYQVEDILRRRIKTVIVEEWLDGSMHVRNNGAYLKHREINPILRAKPAAGKNQTVARTRKPYIPPKDHPWRCYKNRTYLQKEQNTKEEKELLLTKT